MIPLLIFALFVVVIAAANLVHMLEKLGYWQYRAERRRQK